MNDTLKSCEWCDKKFTAKRSTAKFCSAACKLKFNRKKEIDDALVEKDLPPTVQASKLPPVKIKHVDAPFHPIELQEAPKTSKDEICRHCGDPWPKFGYCLHNGPDYYIYGTVENPDQTWDRVCVRCGKDFTTPLSLMRFCSDMCKKEVMVVIANGPHPNYVKWAQR